MLGQSSSPRTRTTQKQTELQGGDWACKGGYPRLSHKYLSSPLNGFKAFMENSRNCTSGDFGFPYILKAYVDLKIRFNLYACVI